MKPKEQKIFANDVTDKGLLPKIYKHLTQFNNNNKKNPTQNNLGIPW